MNLWPRFCNCGYCGRNRKREDMIFAQTGNDSQSPFCDHECYMKYLNPNYSSIKDKEREV